MKKFIVTIIGFSLLAAAPANSSQEIVEKLSGKVLLQVESSGEAWYVNPKDLKRYYLGRPGDAFAIMRGFALGISNIDLNKIPVGLIDNNNPDLDNDGLEDRLEDALGTDPGAYDTDGDNFNDRDEIISGFDPLSPDKISLYDNDFTSKHLGKIFLQTEGAGEAWYINPSDKKRYYLGRPADAFFVMNRLSLGISNNDLNKISIGYVAEYFPVIPINIPPQTCTLCPPDSASTAISGAADAIRSGNLEKAKIYFTDHMQDSIKYTLNFLNPEERLILGNILSGSKPNNTSNGATFYLAEVWWQNEKIPVEFRVEKQENGTWLIANL